MLSREKRDGDDEIYRLKFFFFLIGLVSRCMRLNRSAKTIELERGRTVNTESWKDKTVISPSNEQ